MAYNLESLITILQQILNPQEKRWILDHNKPQLASLLQKSASLKQILESSSPHKIEILESQIRDAAHKAEDIIESHFAEQMRSCPGGGRGFTFSTPDLQEVIQQLDSLTNRAEQLKESSSNSAAAGLEEDLSQLNHRLAEMHRQLAAIIPAAGMRGFGKTTLDELRQVKLQIILVAEQVAKLVKEKTAASNNSSSGVVVGVDKDLNSLKERLVEARSELEIVPIVGMGGIGKTTLARNLYKDPLVVEHFKLRAWATISQYYNMQAVLLGLLRCIIGEDAEQHKEKNNSKLKDILRKSLFDRKYIVVLDDIWSSKFWHEIKSCFLGNNKGSRILITARESNVAKDVSPLSEPHVMRLLNKSRSWDLLREVVFGEVESPPPALERIGKHIARKCGGLPLAIHVIGGVLSEANGTTEFWESVAKDVTSAVAKKDELSKIFSLSYNQLPSHLRPCFLYMGAFPEDHEIKASRLIRLWVAEGFLKSKGDRSLEEEAEDCLKALVDRNLVSVRGFKLNGRPKRYGIHGRLRDLCLKEAERQRFVQVEKRRLAESGEEDSTHSLRRVSQHPSHPIDDASGKVMRLARSFLFTGVASRDILSRVFYGLTLLRVLDILEIMFLRFPPELLHILNLRYLAFSYSSEELPSDITRLWSLQTLLIRSSVDVIALPSEILQMAELRHIMVHKAEIKIESGNWNGMVLEKLQTITIITNPSVYFLQRIPNIRNLQIGSVRKPRLSLEHHSKLETLKFRGNLKRALQLRLPPSLRSLSLTRCKLLGRFMRSLCDVEVLKLHECDLGGEEWDATGQIFCKLQFLLLDRLQLVKWEADEASFPRLRHLVIRGCSALEEIPCRIGEIMALKVIELDNHCSDSLVSSAEDIISERRDNGDNDLQLIRI